MNIPNSINVCGNVPDTFPHATLRLPEQVSYKSDGVEIILKHFQISTLIQFVITLFISEWIEC